MTTATELSRITRANRTIDLVPDALVRLTPACRAMALAALAARDAAMVVSVSAWVGPDGETLAVFEPAMVEDVGAYRLVVSATFDGIHETRAISWSAIAAVEIRVGLTPDDLRARALDAAGIA